MWGARYRSGDAPAPYQHGKFVLDDAGCSVLESGENSDLPQAHEQALEAALEEAAQAAARGERAVRPMLNMAST